MSPEFFTDDYYDDLEEGNYDQYINKDTILSISLFLFKYKQELVNDEFLNKLKSINYNFNYEEIINNQKISLLEICLEYRCYQILDQLIELANINTIDQPILSLIFGHSLNEWMNYEDKIIEYLFKFKEKNVKKVSKERITSIHGKIIEVLNNLDLIE